MSMSLSSELLAILRCPESKQELIYFPDGLDADPQPFLLCPASRLRFGFDNGIPVMLADEALRVDESTCQGLLARARELGLPMPRDLSSVDAS